MKLYNTIGVVACGGKSSRMGTEKYLLQYHGMPQYKHAAALLQGFCGSVFFSLNAQQIQLFPFPELVVADQPNFCNSGPIAAVLSAHAQFPQKAILLLGCDYPLLTENDILELTQLAATHQRTTAFYNSAADCYEPLIAWYHPNDLKKLLQQYSHSKPSLQGFLQALPAKKYHPADAGSMRSIDDPVLFAQTRKALSTSTVPYDKQ